MLKRFFNFQTKTIGMAAGILAVSSLISRGLGIIREYLLAKMFGAGPDLDIYFTAFRIPDLVYNILIAGGIVVAFLPLFSNSFSDSKEKAWEFTNNILNIFLFLLVSLSACLFIAAPYLIKLIAPGFSSEQINSTCLLTRIMLFSPILFGLSSVFSGVLQYFNRFLVYSFCPILYNLGIIFGIIVLSPCLGIFGVGLGVVMGSFFHFVIQVPSAVNCGFRYKPVFNFNDQKIKELIRLMVPRTFGVSANQIILLVVTAIASTISAGSISIFNFSYNLQYFPIGIVGISFAVAAFPVLSKASAENKKQQFIESFCLVFRRVLYLIMPLSVLFFTLRNQIVEIILRHGEFTQISAQLTSACLGAFCLGIFAAALVPLIYRSFFSLKNTKTPALIAVLGMFLDIVLSFFFVWILAPDNNNFFQLLIRSIFSLNTVENIQVLGLALAFSITAIFQLVLSMFLLYQDIGDFELKKIFLSFLKISFASVLMAIGIYVCLFLIHPQNTWIVFWQTGIGTITGISIYLLSTFFLKSPEIKNIIYLLRGFKQSHNIGKKTP